MCLQFAKSACINQDGHYEIGLPWILGHDRLPNNFDMARKRLETSTKQLNTLKLFEQYHIIFIEWREEGIIEDVAVEELNAGARLPYRPVVRPDSKTTPVRPVFDASCKSPGSPSLNDCQENGPNLIEHLQSVLLRFREHRFGLIADIKPAFLMISVRKKTVTLSAFFGGKMGRRNR